MGLLKRCCVLHPLRGPRSRPLPPPRSRAPLPFRRRRRGSRLHRWLLGEGGRPERTVFADDSSAVGLAVATIVEMRESGTPLPPGGVPISPWVDLRTPPRDSQPYDTLKVRFSATVGEEPEVEVVLV